MPAALNLAGQQFGRWTVLRKVSSGKWECKCSCSDKTIKTVYQKHLSGGASLSCGCLRREMTIERSTTHGLSGDKGFQKEQKAQWRRKNKKIILDQAKEYRERPGMQEKKALYMADYRKRNPEATAELNARRRAAKGQAIPPWGKEQTKQAFKELKAAAKILEQASGVKYHIDHIVPLKGKIHGIHVVCGLHVYNNLAVVPALDNLQKNCTTWPNMPDEIML